MSSNVRAHGPLPNAMRKDDHPETYIPHSTASKTTVDPRRHAPSLKHPVTTPGATCVPSSSAHHGHSPAWPPPKDP
ncbi:hypothetical protein RSAG8_04205, partial [Rhizoctonia solani AG-8 WAC10335]